MVDHAVFLSWLAQQMQISNLAQAIFVARIVDEYLEGMLPYRALQRALIDGCLMKLAEVCYIPNSRKMSIEIRIP